MPATSQVSLLLQKQPRDLMKKPVDGFSAGLVDDSNVFDDGGYFNAIMSFPSNSLNSPPTVRFTSE
ncbi:ubiquitin-conjugating enzyme, partial [Musa troglodytarum]